MAFYSETKNRRTGTTIQVVRASVAGYDDAAGPWATACLDHSEVVNHETLAHARGWASNPDDWCSECATLAIEKGIRQP